MVDMMYPDVGMATVELLERLGMEVVFPEEQTCCGQPAFNGGFRDESRQLARRFIEVFEPLLASGYVDAVVAPSGSCTTMTSHFYLPLFAQSQDKAMSQRVEALAASTFELTEFIVDVLGVTDVGARFTGKLTYHACCHLLRELRVDRQPRALLANVDAAQPVALEGDEECCGFGGLFSIKQAAISTAMGERKINNLQKCGADTVALCDVSCMTHINGLLEKQARRCRAIHIAEILNQHMQVVENSEDVSGSEPVRPSPQSFAKRSPNPAPAKPRRWQDV